LQHHDEQSLSVEEEARASNAPAYRFEDQCDTEENQENAGLV
jgi:hypothetical protein